MRRILIVGGGGREEALRKKILEHNLDVVIRAAPGNAGTCINGFCHPVSATDIDGQVALAQELEPKLVIIGGEDPLALGLADRLRELNIPVFGPSAAATQIEADKAFAKAIMKVTGTPTAGYRIYYMPKAAFTYLREASYPLVVKANGLAQGKGVFVCHNHEEASQAVVDLMIEKTLGEAGETILIEDFLEGPEFSILTFCDGTNFVWCQAITDHKRLGEGDTGPNTGGMGAICPVPYCEPAMAEEVAMTIIKPVVDEMRRRGTPFVGCLYLGGILTKDGSKVLEWNCRFGDPETQVTMCMLDEDPLQLMIDAANGNLGETRPARWKTGACCNIVAASGGYPGKYEKGIPIYGLGGLEEEDVSLFLAGVKVGNGVFMTDGGRVLSISATAPDLRSAIEKANSKMEQVKFEGMQYRRDIGLKALGLQDPVLT